MKKALFLCFLLAMTGGVSCRKKPSLPPPKPEALPVSAPPVQTAPEIPPARQPEPAPEPDQPPPPLRPEPDPTTEADLLFAHGDLVAAEAAYRTLLADSLDGPAQGKVLLHLGMIYADPSFVLYDPKKALERLKEMDQADPVVRSQAATLAHLLERLLELEADRRAIRNALDRVEEELQKLKGIDERRGRRP